MSVPRVNATEIGSRSYWPVCRHCGDIDCSYEATLPLIKAPVTCLVGWSAAAIGAACSFPEAWRMTMRAVPEMGCGASGQRCAFARRASYYALHRAADVQ